MISWITPAGFLFTATESVYTSTTLLTSGTNVTYNLLSGKLPTGLNISTTGTIYGTTEPVLNKQTNKFVIRAKNSSTTIDRTFSIDVQGSNKPTWTTITIVSTTTTSTLTTSTIEGYIPLGIDSAPYALNKQYIDFQLTAIATTAPDQTKINFFIGDNDGKLPPDLTLSQNGKIQGILNYFSESDVNTNSNYTSTVYLSKVYDFSVTATDGVENQKREFKILAIDPNLFKVDPSVLGINDPMLDLNLLTPTVSYLQPVQFIYGNDLGTVRAENNTYIPIKIYNPAPLIGSITYTLITGTSVSTRLPKDLVLDPTTGYIYGFIPYQPAYTRNYNLTVNVTKNDYATGQAVTVTNTLTLAVKGMVESTIKWVSSSSLGTLTTGEISDLSIKAAQVNSNYNIKYQQISGTLPPGLTLLADGSIAGRIDYGTTGTYTFNVEAKDVYELSAIEREFTITAIDDSKTYTEIYMRPFLPLEKRQQYSDFINNEFIFPPSFIYRYLDPNFGIQHDLKIVLEFGIEKVDIEKFVQAMESNFYRKQFYFGKLKTAIAKNQTGQTLYEIVYADAVDNMINSQNISVSQSISINNEFYYPSSIDNMRLKFESIELDDSSIISVNEYHLPKFMKTYQNNEYIQPKYIKVIPICYALPGYGQQIINRIKLNGFDFKSINFDVDRIIIKNTLEDDKEKYLLFGKRTISS